MTMYARSDVKSHAHSPRNFPDGRVDETDVCPFGVHLRPLANPKEVRAGAEPIYEGRLEVTCPICEPELAKFERKIFDKKTELDVQIGTWSSDPSDIPLTDIEKRLRAQEKEKAEAATLAGQLAIGAWAQAQAQAAAASTA